VLKAFIRSRADGEPPPAAAIYMFDTTIRSAGGVRGFRGELKTLSVIDIACTSLEVGHTISVCVCVCVCVCAYISDQPLEMLQQSPHKHNSLLHPLSVFRVLVRGTIEEMNSGRLRAHNSFLPLRNTRNTNVLCNRSYERRKERERCFNVFEWALLDRLKHFLNKITKRVSDRESDRLYNTFFEVWGNTFHVKFE